MCIRDRMQRENFLGKCRCDPIPLFIQIITSNQLIHSIQALNGISTAYATPIRFVHLICSIVGVKTKLPRLINLTLYLSLIHISEPTRLGMISYAVFCLKKKNKLVGMPS
eukprot:TRINITY_DN11732_c0_g2_i9.p1 TRINITY_DN11732_c0_g2~~TRINITY_DN11732_c0_g2_i9.p1  ORF type:complete len:110 (-),score=10.40 TRINITY_DN11732_c0_g2_i9:7-336(-)